VVNYETHLSFLVYSETESFDCDDKDSSDDDDYFEVDKQMDVAKLIKESGLFI